MSEKKNWRVERSLQTKKREKRKEKKRSLREQEENKRRRVVACQSGVRSLTSPWRQEKKKEKEEREENEHEKYVSCFSLPFVLEARPVEKGKRNAFLVEKEEKKAS